MYGHLCALSCYIVLKFFIVVALIMRKAYYAKNMQAARNLKSYKEAVRILEQVSVSCQGEERIQLLRQWLFSLREIERQNAGSAENDEKYSEESLAKYDSSGKSDVVSAKIWPYLCSVFSCCSNCQV